MDPTMQDAVPVIAILGVIFFVFIIMLIPTIFYLLTLQKTLAAVQEKNQAMSPGMVWLNLIPIFALGWHFYIVAKIRDSLKAEYSDRGLTGEDDFGYKLGLTMCILGCCGLIPVIGGLISLGCLVVWIIYWVKIAGYKKELVEATPASHSGAASLAPKQEEPPAPQA